MKRIFQISILAALLFVSGRVSAEVYMLGRGRGGNGSAIGFFVGNEQTPLHTETVLTNGRKFKLEIYQSQQTLEEIYKKLLLKRNKNTTVSTNGKLVRYRSELQNKMVEHLLFAGNGTSTVVFRILLPRKFSAGKSWNSELPPLPGGARSELVLELPERGSILGLFNNAFGTPQGNLRAVLSNLSDQWYISADESLMPRGRGALLTGKKRGIMLVGFSDDGTGFFYLKK